ncbi:MAG: L-aspartate oxidase [Anaerolineae bacterium]|nr:L-aspartate oxidase [Anaerolineae bacterium]MCX8067824.1 L-aspartate oxidase [Anaerolineae bacterium]MDW7991682.1 L-aspartate oxidase [Anaerolineae bacterium]
MSELVETDVLIIGCGIAGATAALTLARDRERQVTVVTRAAEPEESNTRYAQGGIVALGEGDSPDLLVQDVLAAGAGLSLPSAVRILAEEGPRLVEELLIRELGVPFDREPDGRLAYGLEGAHSRPRILHVGDATGQAIIRALVAALRECPNVRLVTRATAVDLITFPHHARNSLTVYEPITCHGAYVLDQATGKTHRYLAAVTVLATGGLGRIYRYTTNPEGARGDGLAMAYRAGARVINAEYVQFHPTVLALPGAEGFLISEAVRGEGGRLLTPDGRPFMREYAPDWGDLAPRDVVARAIHHEMVTNGYPYVLLDIASALPPERIRERFPTIYERCRSLGLDITAQPIPVVPAAHYFCGGVWTDEWGRTTVRNLYAVGEVACTGVHGANRLASTSLLEGLVWGHRAAQDIAARGPLTPVSPEEVPPWEETGVEEADPALIWRDLRAIQHTMWNYVGLTRSERRLTRALRDLRHLKEQIDDFYRASRLTDSLVGLRHAVQAALLVTEAAYHNRQSRGCHYRE